MCLHNARLCVSLTHSLNSLTLWCWHQHSRTHTRTQCTRSHSTCSLKINSLPLPLTHPQNYLAHTQLTHWCQHTRTLRAQPQNSPTRNRRTRPRPLALDAATCSRSRRRPSDAHDVLRLRESLCALRHSQRQARQATERVATIAITRRCCKVERCKRQSGLDQFESKRNLEARTIVTMSKILSLNRSVKNR
jgi:hypothetical protein